MLRIIHILKLFPILIFLMTYFKIIELFSIKCSIPCCLFFQNMVLKRNKIACKVTHTNKLFNYAHWIVISYKSWVTTIRKINVYYKMVYTYYVHCTQSRQMKHLQFKLKKYTKIKLKNYIKNYLKHFCMNYLFIHSYVSCEYIWLKSIKQLNHV